MKILINLVLLSIIVSSCKSRVSQSENTGKILSEEASTDVLSDVRAMIASYLSKPKILVTHLRKEMEIPQECVTTESLAVDVIDPLLVRGGQSAAIKKIQFNEDLDIKCKFMYSYFVEFLTDQSVSKVFPLLQPQELKFISSKEDLKVVFRHAMWYGGEDIVSKFQSIQNESDQLLFKKFKASSIEDAGTLTGYTYNEVNTIRNQAWYDLLRGELEKAARYAALFSKLYPSVKSEELKYSREDKLTQKITGNPEVFSKYIRLSDMIHSGNNGTAVLTTIKPIKKSE